MVAAWSSETLVSYHISTRRQNPEDHKFETSRVITHSQQGIFLLDSKSQRYHQSWVAIWKERNCKNNLPLANEIRKP